MLIPGRDSGIPSSFFIPWRIYAYFTFFFISVFWMVILFSRHSRSFIFWLEKVLLVSPVNPSQPPLRKAVPVAKMILVIRTLPSTREADMEVCVIIDYLDLTVGAPCFL